MEELKNIETNVEANIERKKLLFILNPRAGTMQASKHLSEILQIFSDSGYLTTVLMTTKSGDARDFAHQYANEYDVVACAGGDGTYNEMIDGVISVGAKCKIGYIPAGSTNDFGASIGLSKNTIEAANAIAHGEAITLDVGSFNGQHFSYVASFGAFTSASYSVPQNIKNIFGHTAYVLQGIKDIVSIKAQHVKVITDEGMPSERVIEEDLVFGAVCNATSVGGVLKLDSFRVDMNDGLMEILLIKSPKNLLDVNSIALSLLANDLDTKDIAFYSAKTVRFEMDPEVPWTLDGEYKEGASDIKIETVVDAVNILV
jgi:lipid kinase, YegS/Rv2252/BmrU family